MEQSVRDAILKKVSEEPFALMLGLQCVQIGKGYARSDAHTSELQ